jgi:ADP-dependent NAD(P)H-hydrate dehydratase / NAD(P)H-hydrate epimerase
MRLVAAEEMRALDRATIALGTPGHVLMERAGLGATEALFRFLPFMRKRGRRAVVVAGKGNNGGDGFVIARALRRRGVRTEVFLLAGASDVAGDAERNLRAYIRGRGTMHEATRIDDLRLLGAALERADVVVDAIFGTGLNSAVSNFHADVIELVNASGVPVLAVDIPSGLNADTGQPMGTAIQAEATATFGFAKIGHVLFPGARLTGRLALVDIGLAPESVAAHPAETWLLDAAQAARLVPLRSAEAHKGDCGHVLIIAGSHGKTGAAQLATRAALRSGAGLVTLVGPASLYPIYAGGVVEAMTDSLPDVDGRIRFDEQCLRHLLEGKTTLLIGPGIGVDDEVRRVVRWLIEHTQVPTVLDADALNCVSDDTAMLNRATAPLVLTPHPGEMSRLARARTADVQADRVATARAFAQQHGCTVVLKGARSVIAAANRHAWINPTGNPGMASGGMGDVLAGVIAALLAQGLRASDAACLAVYVHGAAADRAAASNGEIGLIASDLIERIPRELAQLGDTLDGD